MWTDEQRETYKRPGGGFPSDFTDGEWAADSDEAGRVFRFDAGQHPNMKPATVPI